MTQNQTQLYNLALSSIGARTKVASPSERSKGAEECSLWYDTIRRKVLRAAFWGCARKSMRLNLLSKVDNGNQWDTTKPEPGWLFKYQAPTDMLTARKLTTGARFILSTDYIANSKSVETDTENALLVYTVDQTDVSLWDAGLFFAMHNALGSAICLGLSGKPARARELAFIADDAIRAARTQNANEQENKQDSIPEWFQARGYADARTITRFTYPYGELISSTGASLV